MKKKKKNIKLLKNKKRAARRSRRSKRELFKYYQLRQGRRGSKNRSQVTTNNNQDYHSLISNRPKYLKDNIKFYNKFPLGYDMDVDYKAMPPLLNLDLHTLNGILPLTTSRFDYIGKNGEVDGKESTVVFTNPLDEEYKYYESIGVTEFQAIQIVLNCFVFEDNNDNSLTGIPYSVSLIPMEKRGEIDTWNINLLKQFDLEKLCQEGGTVFTKFNPFLGWQGGYVSHYSIFSKIGTDEFPDCIGFVWGMYFLSPEFDKKEVQIIQDHTFSDQTNAKYRKFKTDLYFKSFKDVRPRRIWGCDSPIELFLLQGMYLRGITPEIQMCIYRNGEIFPNYYRMQEQEIFVGQDKLITAADFYFPDKKLAVFCDGREFHDEEKDNKINNKLAEFGIRSIRFTGKEITENLEKALDKLEKELKK